MKIFKENPSKNFKLCWKTKKKIIILREYFSGDFSFYPNKEFT